MLRQLTEHASEVVDREARAALQSAKREEERGNYEEAQALLHPFWQGPGHYPRIDSLSPETSGEQLLRCGSLTGWIGHVKHLQLAQAWAIDLFLESLKFFEHLEDPEKIAEAKIGMAICHLRQSKFDEARSLLTQALDAIKDPDSEQRARVFLNRAVIENLTGRLRHSLMILTENAPLFERVKSHTLRGRFHITLANALSYVGSSEERVDYIDRSFVEYSAASYHFEQAGHIRQVIIVNNQLAFLALSIGKYNEAHEYLNKVYDMAVGFADISQIVTLKETRTRILIAEDRMKEANEILQPVISALKESGDQVKLAEALTTWGTLLARTRKYEQARHTLEQATDIAAQAKHSENAGRAQLAILEELIEQLELDESAYIYQRADHFLTQTQHPEMLCRLRAAARMIISRTPLANRTSQAVAFIHASRVSSHLIQSASRLALTDASLMITGERGTGKEVLARLVHEWSDSTGEFKTIDCSLLSGEPFEAALMNFKVGTLYLDEIAHLTAEDQLVLLRSLTPRSVVLNVSPFPESQQVRLICATSQDMNEELLRGHFRTDLYYRLRAFHLEVPPLRHRTEDIPVLADHFIKESGSRYKKDVRLTTQALDLLRTLPLRGNVRELRTLIDRTVASAPDKTLITADAVETLKLRQVGVADLYDPWANCSLEKETDKYEGELIRLALQSAGGRISKTAKLLGIKHQTLGKIIKTRQQHLLQLRKPEQARKRSRKKISPVKTND